MSERARSWVEAANDPEGDFPIENLPFGVIDRPDLSGGRVATAIGDSVVDLGLAAEAGYLDGVPSEIRETLGTDALNPLAAHGSSGVSQVRSALARLLAEAEPRLRDATDRERIVLLRERDGEVQVHLIDGETPDESGLVAIEPDDFIWIRRTGVGRFSEEILPILSGISSSLSSAATVLLIEDRLTD